MAGDHPGWKSLEAYDAYNILVDMYGEAAKKQNYDEADLIYYMADQHKRLYFVWNDLVAHFENREAA